MTDTGFVITGFGLMLIAGIVAYAWRQRAMGRRRLLGGIMLILAPICVQMVLAIVASLPGVVPWMNAMSPLSDITFFEAAWFFTFFWTPFWSFGALCGYMLRSVMERPLRLW